MHKRRICKRRIDRRLRTGGLCCQCHRQPHPSALTARFAVRALQAAPGPVRPGPSLCRATLGLALGCLLVCTDVAAQLQLTRPADAPAVVAPQGTLPQVTRGLPVPLAADAQDLLDRVNAHRSAGATCGHQHWAPVPPLSWNAALAQAALQHSADMAAQRSVSHTGADGSRVGQRAQRQGYDWVALGENVSAGFATQAESLAGWMASPGHCASIMAPQFRELGVAAARASGDTPVWYRTMVLGKP